MVRESLPHCRSTRSQRKQHSLSELLISSTSSISFPFYRLRTLQLSCRSFSTFSRLFSMLCALFVQNTRGYGVSLSLNPIHEDQNDTKPSQFRFHSREMPASHLHRSPMPLRCSRTW